MKKEIEPRKEYPPKFLDWEVLKEEWNVYRLYDGTIFKTKLVLTHVLKTASGERSSYDVGTTRIVTVLCPQHLIGEPSKEIVPKEELNKYVVERNIRFDTIKSDWNEYLVRDEEERREFIIRILETLVSISRTSKRDNLGRPIYVFNSSGQVVVHPKSQRGL